MIYNEAKRDLFEVDDSYHLAHCVSADMACGAGIAVEFAKKFSAIKKLRNEHLEVGTCKQVGRVFNLITKRVYYGKPTYGSLQESLEHMRELCINECITKVAIPKIGSGLDRLSWPKVSGIIHEIFEGTDIEILVCSL